MSFIRHGMSWFVCASCYIVYYTLHVLYYIDCIQYVLVIAALCGTVYIADYMLYVYVTCIVCVMYAMDGIIYVIYSILNLVDSTANICYIVSIIYTYIYVRI